MRRLSWRRAREHERRGSPLSSLQRRARTSGRSRAADQYLPRRAAAIDAASLREQGVARTRGLCRAAIARHADRNRGRRAHQALPASRPRPVHPAPRTAQSLLCTVSRRQLGPKARRRCDPAGPPDRISTLSPRMASARIIAATAAQLPVRNARYLLSLRRAPVCRSRTLFDVARARHAGLARGPPFGPLRRVPMPGARLEIAELLVLHLVELAEELDHLLILVAMVSGDVVSWAVPQRTPDDRDLFLAHHLARVLQMHEVLELERDVMKLHVRTGEEVHGVMIRIAAHEAEEIADPVGDAKAEHSLVERHGALDVRREKGDMSELERTDTGNLGVFGEVAPFLEQLDRRSFVVFEAQHLAHPGN